MDKERLRSLGLVDAERLLDEIHLWECLGARDAEGYDDVHLFVDKSGVRLASFMTSEHGGRGLSSSPLMAKADTRPESSPYAPASPSSI